MVDTGYVTVWDTECIIVEESDGLYLIPKEKDDVKRIRPHFDDQNFVLRYSGGIGFDSVAFVDRIQHQMNHTIRIFPKYIINRCHVESFSGFEMTGEAIDDFLVPFVIFMIVQRQTRRIRKISSTTTKSRTNGLLALKGKLLL